VASCFPSSSFEASRLRVKPAPRSLGDFRVILVVDRLPKRCQVTALQGCRWPGRPADCGGFASTSDSSAAEVNSRSVDAGGGCAYSSLGLMDATWHQLASPACTPAFLPACGCVGARVRRDRTQSSSLPSSARFGPFSPSGRVRARPSFTGTPPWLRTCDSKKNSPP